MAIGLLKLFNTRKTILLAMVFFVFLFFGSEALAVACSETGWNKESCDVSITYTDPCPGGQCSKLATCKYRVESGGVQTYPGSGWASAGDCNNQAGPVSFTVPLSIGDGQNCRDEGNGACIVYSKVTDTAGNEGLDNQPYNIDYTPPVTSIVCNGASCTTSWYDVQIGLTCADTGGSNCQNTYYCTDQTNTCFPSTLYTAPFNLITEGTNYVRFYSTDNAGNTETTQYKTVKVDNTPPTVSVTGAPANWQNTDASALVSCSDTLSGCDSATYRLKTYSSNPGSCSTNYSNYTLTSPKTISSHLWVCGAAKDNAGKVGFSTPVEFKIDKAAPETTIQCNGADCITDWYNAALSITFSCQDNPGGSGCDITYYCRDTTNSCSPTNPYSSSFSPIAEGTSYVRYFSTDVAGNVETVKSQQIKWDSMSPTADVDGAPANWENANQTATVTCSDDAPGSGCNSVSYAYQVFSSNPGTCPGTGYTSGSSVIISSHSWVCSYVEDNAGNSDISDPAEFKVDKEDPTAEVISPAPSTWQTPTGFNAAFRYSDTGDSGLTTCQYKVVSSGVETLPWTSAGICSGSGPVDLTKDITVGPTGNCRNSGIDTCTVYVRSQDEANNWSTENSRSFSIDLEDPSCSINLSTSEVNIGEFFDIDVSGSSDDVGIVQVRFSSDDFQDGSPTGSWTSWYDWNVSSGDWDAVAKTKGWSFATGGDKEVWVQTKDQAGQTSQCSQNVHVNIPPTCELLSASPISGYLPLSVIFTCSGNDSDGTIVAYQWDFDGDGTWDQTTAINNTGYTYNTAGTYCVKSRVQDNDGVWSATPGSCPATCAQQVTVSEDGTSPIVTVEGAPADWQNSNASVSISCTDTETGCDSATYRLKTYSSDPGTCSTVYSDYTLSSPQTITSRQWLCGAAKDNSGNEGFSSPVEFKVDKDIPQVTAFNLSPTTLNIANPNTTISWTVTDSGGSHLSHVEVWRAPDVGGIPGTWSQIGGNYNAPVDSDGPWSSSAIDSPSDGIYWYGIHVLDNATNMETEPSSIKVTVDKTKPTATIYRWSGSNWVVDTGGSWHNSNFVRRSYDSDSESGLDKCYYYLYDNIAGESTTGILERTCSTLNIDINITVGASDYCPSQGENACSLYVYSTDQAGNTSDMSNQGTGGSGIIVYHIDWEPPLVGETSPTTADEGIAQTYSVTVSDNLELNPCWLYVDGANEGSMTISPFPCQDGASCTASKEYTFASGGIHTMYARCADHYESQIADYLNYTSGVSVDVSVTANNSPEITDGLSYTTSPCTVPTTQTDCIVNFTVEATDADGDDLTYSWIFGDGETSDLQNPSHHYSAANTYPVMVTVSDSRGGQDSGGVNITVTDPTLSVDLTADPSVGVDSLYDVDLTAIVSGTMLNTINYKFDCTDDGSWELEINNTNTNPYTALDLCDYTSIGTYTAKVFIERGDGSAQDTAIISVITNQSPICQVSVPENGVINQPITIGVGGSSDPEESLASVNFSSDNNLNGSADGSWDPSGPYDWNTSSGDWGANTKTMKWSFTQIGVYEVWAEVKDDANQTASCYDTITITECLAGETKSCTSPQGCAHTLTCTSEGTWPSCPTDECALGFTQSCGINGTQTCTDACTWGTCVEPPENCSWPPDISCPTCQYPECIDFNWTCQSDPIGTDCGDCRLCDGAGSCNYICSEICVADACYTCEGYYDGGCGYGSCGILQVPVWSYSGGTCQYSCQYNIDCEGEVPPLPPECQRSNPEVTLVPSSQPGTAGDTLAYTVYIENKDSLNCNTSTFNLNTGESCNEPGWDCSNLPDLTISPGQSTLTTLNVTSPSPPYPTGDYEVSVTATNIGLSEYFSTGYAIYNVTNNPPSVINLSTDSSGQCFTTYPPVYLSWEFSDVDAGDTQSAYQVQIDNNSDFSSLKANSGKVYTSGYEYSPPAGTLSFNSTYYWRVRVWDSYNIVSDCGYAGGWCYPSGSFTTDSKYPWPDFEWFPVAPTAGELIQFCSKKEEDCLDMNEDRQILFYDDGLGTRIWQWDFDKDDIADSYEKNPTYNYSDPSPVEGYSVELSVIDGLGKGPCSISYSISITEPLPEWQEVPPF